MTTIKLFIMDSDDLTPEAIATMPEATAVPPEAIELTDEYYQVAYDLGYRTFGTEDEEVFLVK